MSLFIHYNIYFSTWRYRTSIYIATDFMIVIMSHRVPISTRQGLGEEFQEIIAAVYCVPIAVQGWKGPL